MNKFEVVKVVSDSGEEGFSLVRSEPSYLSPESRLIKSISNWPYKTREEALEIIKLTEEAEKIEWRIVEETS